jgi:tRNA-dihydrouridine synthase B
MDGVSDAPFRQITAKYGQPSLLITEFTSVEALNYGGAKALEAFIYSEVERPVVAQIYGRNPESFYKACFVAAELALMASTLIWAARPNRFLEMAREQL